MRSAIILPWTIRLDMGDWDPYSGPDSCRFMEPGYVLQLDGPEVCPEMERLRSDLKPFVLKDSGIRWNCCESVDPHRDEVFGDYTLGVVYRGGGVLFTGNGRNVGVLRPGSVYFLNNKKLHGLKKDPEQMPMVFATVDFVSDRFQDMARFLKNRGLSYRSSGQANQRNC